MARRVARFATFSPVIVLTLLLSSAAVLTNLPASVDLGWPRGLFKTLIWISTIAILLVGAGGKRFREKTILLSLAVVALFAAASYFNFGRFHGHGRVLHHHELFHYSMGSKYFEELGYEGLYSTTLRALIENDRASSERITLVKNLRTYQLEGRDICWQRSESLVSLFSEERWEKFKKDIRYFQSKMPPDAWRSVLIDHGFNATPFWIFFGSLLTQSLELNDRTLMLLTLLDPILIMGMFLLLGYAFGLKTVLIFAVFFFANFFGTFDFTGNAFEI